jgi:hypothetical protein
MLQSEILICEFFSAVDGPRACAVAVDEVSTLDHEAFDLGQVSFISACSGSR